MKKELLILALVAVMMFNLIACGASQNSVSGDGDVENTSQQQNAEAPEGSGNQTSTDNQEDKVVGEGNYGGILNIRLIGETDSVDPVIATANTAYTPLWHFMETVISKDAEGNYHPLVCEYEMNEDSTLLTLTVREGVTFHDGSTVTSADIEASINRWIREVPSKQASFGELLDSYEVVDDKTIVYTFAKPAPLALFALSNPIQGAYVMKADFLNTLGEGETIVGYDPELYIGTGCYKFSQWLPGQYISVTRYDDYKPYVSDASGMAGTRYAYADEIRFVPVADHATAAMSLVAGELDFAISIDDALVADALTAGTVYQHDAEMGYAPIFVFNNSDQRPDSIVHNLDFRRAVMACLDTYECMYAIGGSADRFILTPCRVPTGSVYENDIVSELWNAVDLDLAKEYLAKSGYNGETLTWITRTNGDNYLPSVVAVEQLKKIGINIDLQVIEAASVNTFREDQSGWDIAVLATPTVQTEPDQDPAFTNGYWVNWNNPEKVELVNKMASEGRLEVRKQYFDRLCELMWNEDIPFIFLGLNLSRYYYNSNVQGVYSGNSYYFWNTWRTDL